MRPLLEFFGRITEADIFFYENLGVKNEFFSKNNFGNSAKPTFFGLQFEVYFFYRGCSSLNRVWRPKVGTIFFSTFSQVSKSRITLRSLRPQKCHFQRPQIYLIKKSEAVSEAVEAENEKFDPGSLKGVMVDPQTPQKSGGHGTPHFLRSLQISGTVC